MVEINEIERLKSELIANWTDNFNYKENSNIALPDYLKNLFLIDCVADQSNTIIQVFDMDNFKLLYTSPNCLEITGFTDVEINNTGFSYWLRTIPLKQAFFHVKSAKFVNDKLKKLQSSELIFFHQCFNLLFKNKKGEKRSMVSSSSCIEWKGNKQKYQINLWRDMTEKFKNDDFCMRYVIGSKTYHYFSTIGKFKEGDILTEKEFEILRLYQKGMSTKEIADCMNISYFTVDNHKKNLLSKFVTTSMQDVAEIAKFIGIIS
jgi:DNA-binding CsgD family transcriptional regulator